MLQVDPEQVRVLLYELQPEYLGYGWSEGV